MTSKPLGEYKKLTEKELHDKKARSLCFRCNDKWVIRHCSRKKKLSILLMSDDKEEQIEGVHCEPPSSAEKMTGGNGRPGDYAQFLVDATC